MYVLNIKEGVCIMIVGPKKGVKYDIKKFDRGLKIFPKLVFNPVVLGISIMCQKFLEPR